MNLHVYSAHAQPATHFVIPMDKRNMHVRHAKRSTAYCSQCGRKRWACYLTVQVYYDLIRYTCRKGRGCRL